MKSNAILGDYRRNGRRLRLSVEAPTRHDLYNISVAAAMKVNNNMNQENKICSVCITIVTMLLCQSWADISR